MTVTVFVYLISISEDFLSFYFSLFPLVSVLIEKIYQALDDRQKYSTVRQLEM